MTIRKTRTFIAYSVMRLLIPNVYKKLQMLSTIPDTINDVPRPMIKFIAQLNLKDLLGAEIGVSQGLNTLNMFEILNIKNLYAVDPYLPYEEKNFTNTIHLNFKDVAFANLKGKPVTWFIEPSISAARKIKEPLDFVYIDACHEYMNVKEDITAWYALLKIGGIIGGHDFNWKEDGVIKAVTEFANNNNLHLNIAYPDWWVLKE